MSLALFFLFITSILIDVSAKKDTLQALTDCANKNVNLIKNSTMLTKNVLVSKALLGLMEFVKLAQMARSMVKNALLVVLTKYYLMANVYVNKDMHIIVIIFVLYAHRYRELL